MKTMKRIMGLVLALAMVLAMSMTTFAAVDVSSHTFEAYQIFAGSQATDGGALGNVTWGDGVDGDALLTAIKADTTIGTDFAACTTAAQVAEKLATYSSNSDQAKAFARLADANKTSTTTAITNNTISRPGYYLIVDTTDVAGKEDAKNLSLLAVSTSVTIATKTDIPSVVKKVDDKNDSNNSEDAVNWQDAADYDIGDEVPYQITATMGDLSNFKTYYVQFNDTMTHLTYVDGSVAVTIDGVDKTDKFTTTWDAATKTLTVVCGDVKALGATSNSKIVVTYKATLDDDANIGSAGNPNTVNLEFSNNPNNSGDGTNKPETGKTPDDTNIVFTYKVIANKVDSNKNALVGASFELFKKGADGNYTSLGVVDGTNASTFEWKGIDDGEYKIVETKTPAGYNKIDDQYFTVTASHVDGDAPYLESLSGNKVEGSVITLTADKTAGSVSTDIENKSGSVLPTTGGMGTTLFYLVGAILVIGAGVLLVTKRRVER